MVDRFYVNGDGNNASDADNWSPTGVPQPGDHLHIENGTLNIRGNDLAGDILQADQPGDATNTLNLSHHAVVTLAVDRNPMPPVDVATLDDTTVNVSGSDTLTLSLSDLDTAHFRINLADHARLTGTVELAQGFSATSPTAVFAGGRGSLFINNGESYLAATRVTFDTDVTGTGSFNVFALIGGPAQVEFSGSVSYGQTVEVSGVPEFKNAPPTPVISSKVLIDHPRTFHGAIALGMFGEVDLAGLHKAESYQLKDDILSIYRGNTVVESLRLTAPPPTSPNYVDAPVTVAQTADGISIDRGTMPAGATLLPIHGGAGSGGT